MGLFDSFFDFGGGGGGGQGGVGNSASTSSTKNTTTTSNISLGVQGGPLLYGQGTTYVDSGGAVSQDAVKNMVTLASHAIDTVSTTLDNYVSKAIQNSAQQSAQSTDLLSGVLQQNAELASNVQSGGATAALSSYQKVLWGVLGLVGVALFFMFRKK